jgi:hypothetical protein
MSFWRWSSPLIPNRPYTGIKQVEFVNNRIQLKGYVHTNFRAVHPTSVSEEHVQSPLVVRCCQLHPSDEILSQVNLSSKTPEVKRPDALLHRRPLSVD